MNLGKDLGRTRASALAALMLIGLAFASEAKVPKAGGVVVTEVSPGKAGDRSGLKEGDLLLEWSWRPAGEGGGSKSGKLSVPLDLDALENSLSAEGRVTLRGSREGQPLELTVAEGEWAFGTRPAFSPADLSAYEKAGTVAPSEPGWLLALSDRMARDRRYGESSWLRLEAARSLVRNEKFEEARDALASALPSPKGKLPTELRAQLFAEVASVRAAMGESEAAAKLYGQAAELWKEASPSGGYGGALFYQAEVAFRRGDLDAAMEGFRESLAALEPKARRSYLYARSTSRTGEIFWTRGRLDEAQVAFQRAYDLMASMAPQGAEMVGFANNLGKVRFRKGDSLGAEEIFRQSVDILKKSQPGSLELARSLNGLGLIVTDLGDYPEAERLLEEAVAIWRKEAPGNPNGWRPISNLGNVYLHRGDLAKAEDCYSEVLEMVRKIAPGSLQETAPLGNLAAVSERRGDYDTAEALLLKVFAITEREAPDSTDLARCHEYLGSVDVERGNVEGGLEHYRKAAEIVRAQAPGSVQLARLVRTQGAIALKTGDPESAEAYLEEALRYFEAVNPNSVDVAGAVAGLGSVDLMRGNAPEALKRLDRAVEMFDRTGLADDTVAEAVYHRGRALWATGRKREAIASVRRSVDLAEDLMGRLGGSSQDKATFLETFAEYFQTLEEYLLEAGESREAYRTVERWRAVEFLKMLAERDLDFGGDLPPGLERERRLAAVELRRAEAEMEGGELAPEELPEVEVRLRAAQKRLEDVRMVTLRASKEVHDLRYPEPLGAEEALARLDAGTLLLEYSVGPERILLFALGPGPGEFSAHVLGASGTELRREVDRFRALILGGGALFVPKAHRLELENLSRKLSGVLLGPVSDRVARADRLLVAPDSALYLLPFAALADPAQAKARGRKAGEFRFLVESKPVHTAASATVYAQLLNRRRGASAWTLEAFGDPEYGTGGARSLWRGRELAPLPATRLEVEVVRDVVGSGRLHLGREATVPRVLSVPKETRILHLACHGFTDEVRPLESALALTPTGAGEAADGGLLQAWRVYEALRVDADLVTLSACETGLGKVLEGEGLVGLTRAFQFAGARSVLASLWAVSDEGTAELMLGFYDRLMQGLPKDEALRAAQVDLLRSATDGRGGRKGKKGAPGGAFSRPFHWAAFQLVGDWK